MRYTLVIKGAPNISQGGQTALDFAKAVLARGHSIFKVFFYQSGVLHGSDMVVLPQDETSYIAGWTQFAQCHSVPLCVCITGALRRGVLDITEAKRYQRTSNLKPPFSIAGLGDLMDAIAQSDRCLNFGRSIS